MRAAVLGARKSIKTWWFNRVPFSKGFLKKRLFFAFFAMIFYEILRQIDVFKEGNETVLEATRADERCTLRFPRSEVKNCDFSAFLLIMERQPWVQEKWVQKPVLKMKKMIKTRPWPEIMKNETPNNLDFLNFCVIFYEKPVRKRGMFGEVSHRKFGGISEKAHFSFLPVDTNEEEDRSLAEGRPM